MSGETGRSEKTCYKCEYGNKHRGSFKLHIKGQHGDGYNKCSLNYKSNIGLKQHFQVKHEFKDDICNNCNYHQRGKHKNCKKIRTFLYDFQNTNQRSHAEHKRSSLLTYHQKEWDNVEVLNDHMEEDLAEIHTADVKTNRLEDSSRVPIHLLKDFTISNSSI